MTLSMKNIGVMSGRLSPTLNNEMQFFPSDRWRDEFHLCKKLKIHNLEWVIDLPSINTNPLLDKTYIDIIKNLGEISCVNNMGAILHFFVQKDVFTMLNKESKKFDLLFEKIFQNCSEIGFDYVEIPFFGKSNINHSDFEKILFNCFIDKILNLAEKYYLKVFIENKLDHNSNLYLLEKINSDLFFVTFDTGNSYVSGHKPNNIINNLKHKIGNIHIKDCNHFGDSVPLGKGNVDFANIFYSLEKINYANNFILEAVKEDIYYNDEKYKAVDTIIKYKNFLNKYLN